MIGKDGRPVGSFAARGAWAAWLAAEHAGSDGIWIKFAKKGSGVESVTQAEAIEVALAFGWIDGQAAKLDDDHFLQRFTPRRSRSRWSRVNREKATALIDRGEMQPAGLREVERARADGRWAAAYEPPSTAKVPDDLRRELERHDGAAELFDRLDSRNRYAILYRVEDARKPETRARRISKYAAMLAEGKTIYP